MFEKILVCLDGSRSAEEILPYFVQERDRVGTIVLLRVLATPEIDIPLVPINVSRPFGKLSISDLNCATSTAHSRISSPISSRPIRILFLIESEKSIGS